MKSFKNMVNELLEGNVGAKGIAKRMRDEKDNESIYVKYVKYKNNNIEVKYLKPRQTEEEVRAYIDSTTEKYGLRLDMHNSLTGIITFSVKEI